MLKGNSMIKIGDPIKWIKAGADKNERYERLAFIVMATGTAIYLFGTFFGPFIAGTAIALAIGSPLVFIGIIIYIYAQFLETTESGGAEHHKK